MEDIAALGGWSACHIISGGVILLSITSFSCCITSLSSIYSYLFSVYCLSPAELDWTLCFIVSVQRLDLQKSSPDDPETVRGQIVISLISRDRSGSGPQVTDIAGLAASIPRDPNELPEG